MLNSTVISKLICPYCFSPIRLKDIINSRYQSKIVVCECDEYPVLEDIIFLHKNDNQNNRRVVQLIREKRNLTAIWTCLYPAPKYQRFIIIGVYLIWKYLGILLPLKTLLLLFRVISSKSARKWFKYLLNRNHNDFRLAIDLFKKTRRNHQLIVDIGSGIGHFQNYLLKEIKRDNIQFLMLEKSFLSLFILSIYWRAEASLLVCCDVEDGIPLRNSVATDVFFIDVFVWIQNKLRILKETHRVLCKKSSLYIIRSFKQSKEMYFCGYGMDPNKIYKLLSQSFSNIRFYVLNLSRSGNSKGFKIVSSDKIPRIGYSCYAIKG